MIHHAISIRQTTEYRIYGNADGINAEHAPAVSFTVLKIFLIIVQFAGCTAGEPSIVLISPNGIRAFQRSSVLSDFLPLVDVNVER